MTYWRSKLGVIWKRLWIVWIVIFLPWTSNAATTSIFATPSSSLGSATVNITSPESLILNLSTTKSGTVKPSAGLNSDSSATLVLQVSSLPSVQASVSPNNTAVSGGHNNLSSLLSSGLTSTIQTKESTVQLVNSARNSSSVFAGAKSTSVSSNVAPIVSSNYTATPSLALAAYSRSVNGSQHSSTLATVRAKQTTISNQSESLFITASPKLSQAYASTSTMHSNSSNTPALFVVSSVSGNLTSGIDMTAVVSSAVVVSSVLGDFMSGITKSSVVSSVAAIESSPTSNLSVVPTVLKKSETFVASSVLSGNFTSGIDMKTNTSSTVAMVMSPTVNMSGLRAPTSTTAHLSQVVGLTSDAKSSTVDVSNSTRRIKMPLSHSSTTTARLTNQTLSKQPVSAGSTFVPVLPSVNHTHKFVSMYYTATPNLSSSMKASLEVNQTSRLSMMKQTLLPTLPPSVTPSVVDPVNQTSKRVSVDSTVFLSMSSNVNQTSKLASSSEQTVSQALTSSSNQSRKLASTGVALQPINSTKVVSTKIASTVQQLESSDTRVTPSLVARTSLTSTPVLSKKLDSSVLAVHVSSKSVPSETSVHVAQNSTYIGQTPIFSTSTVETLSISNSSTVGTRILPTSLVTRNGTKDSASTSSSQHILQSRSITKSSLPDSPSSSDDFILMSYATPCYIYYVITKTVTMATTNQTVAMKPVTPTLTLGKLNVSTARADIPTVTVAAGMSSPTVGVDTSSPEVSGTKTTVSGVHVSMSSVSATVSIQEAVKSTKSVAPTSNLAVTAADNASSQAAVATASLGRTSIATTVVLAATPTQRVMSASSAVSRERPEATESVRHSISISTHNPVTNSQSLYLTQAKESPSQIFHVPNATYSPSSDLLFVASSTTQSLTNSRAISIPNATVSKLIARLSSTQSKVIPVPSETHSQLIPNPNSTRSQLILVPTATHSQLIPNPNVTHSQLIPTPTATQSQIITSTNSTNNQLVPNPSETHSKVKAVPNATLSQTIVEHIVTPTVNLSAAQQDRTGIHSRAIPPPSPSLMEGSFAQYNTVNSITPLPAQALSSGITTIKDIKVSSTKQVLTITAANKTTSVSVASSVLPISQEKSSKNGSKVVQTSPGVSSSVTNVSGISQSLEAVAPPSRSTSLQNKTSISSADVPSGVPSQTQIAANNLLTTASSAFAKFVAPTASTIANENSTVDDVTPTPPLRVTLSATPTPPLSGAYSQGSVFSPYSHTTGSAPTSGSGSPVQQNSSPLLVSSAERTASGTVVLVGGTQSVMLSSPTTTQTTSSVALFAQPSRKRRDMSDSNSTGNFSGDGSTLSSTKTNASTVTALPSHAANTPVQTSLTQLLVSPSHIPKPDTSSDVLHGGNQGNSSTVADKIANFIQSTTSQIGFPQSGNSSTVSSNRAASVDGNLPTSVVISPFSSIKVRVSSTQTEAASASKSATTLPNNPSESVRPLYETAASIVTTTVNSTSTLFPTTSNNVSIQPGQTTGVQAMRTANATVALSPSLGQQTVSLQSHEVANKSSTLFASKTTTEQALPSATVVVAPSSSSKHSSPDVTNGTRSSTFVIAMTSKQQASPSATTTAAPSASVQRNSSTLPSDNKSSTLVVARSTEVHALPNATMAVSPSPSVRQSSRGVTNKTSVLVTMTTGDKTVFPSSSTRQNSSEILKATHEISTQVVGMTTTPQVSLNTTISAVRPSVEVSSAKPEISTNQSSASAVMNSTSYPSFPSAAASTVPRVNLSTSKLAVMKTATLPVEISSTSVTTIVPTTNLSKSKFVAIATATPPASPSINATSASREMSVVVSAQSPQSRRAQETMSTFVPVVQSVSSPTPMVLSPSVTVSTSEAVSGTQFQLKSSTATEATNTVTLSSSTLSYSDVAMTTKSLTSSVPSQAIKHPVITMSSLGMCYVVVTTKVVQATVIPTPSTSLLLPVNATSVELTPTNSTVGIKQTLTVSSKMQQNATAMSPTVTVVSAAVTSTLKLDSTLAIHLNATVMLSSTASANTTLLPGIPSSSAVTQPLPTSPVQSAEPTQLPQTSSLVESTATAPSSTILTSTISPSATSTVVASTSTVTPTAQPLPETLVFEIEVPTDVNVRQQTFKADLEAKLEKGFIDAKKNSARRRRATQGVDATITKMQREGFSKSVNVEFYITENNKTVPATDAAKTFSSVSAKKLGETLSYKIVQVPHVTGPPIESRYIVSMVIRDFPNTDISIDSNKVKLQNKLAAYYKAKVSLQAVVATVINKILHESSGKVYLEFYTTSNNQKILGSEVVKAFEGATLVSLTTELEQIVLVAPYIADTLKATKYDYVSIRVGLKNSSQDLSESAFRQELGDKLAIVYKEARDARRARRKKRAVGSITATIVNATRSSSPSQADVVFFVADAGDVLNASYVVLIMNHFSILRMTLSTKPYSVFVAPAAYFVPQATDAPPVPITPEPVQYWIIGAVLGPVAFIVIILLTFLLCWRWKKGAPQTKVEPETMEMMKRERAKMTTGHFDVARYAQGNEPSMKTTALNRAYESDGDEKPVRRETSLRRKVQKQRAVPPPRDGRKHRAYEESEEEDEESVTDVTPTGSRHRLVQAQPGPGMLYKKTQQVPVKSSDRPRPPLRAPPPQQLEEDSETEESETESESESVMTTRTDQTKHSAAQVPAVAVVGAASGPPRYAPVRFRSSVHPAPSLPPLDLKHTSLVGPREEDERDIRKNKLTKKELKQKADIERWRNKQRQRERKEGRNVRDRDRPESKSEKKAWARSQGQIDSVLEPGAGMEPIIRGRKRRPRKPKKRGDSIPTEDQSVQLSSYRDLRSPRAEREGREERKRKSSTSASPTESESEIDMEETRRRMHTLLEDAFTLFGPSLTGKRRKGDEEPHQAQEPTQLLQQAHPLSGQPQTMPPGVLARPMVPPRYAGSQPALPEPPPAHGRASEPTPRQRRRLATTQPQAPRMPGYPVRPPVRPPLVSKDPMVVWDPTDRQRYVNQRLGYPMYGRPPPGSFAYTDPSGQGPVYLTPVQQQPDGLGGSIWSPYAAEDAMAELYPDLSKANYPGALGTSPQKDSSYLSHPSVDSSRSHDTVLDMNDGYSRQRPPALGQSPQPLIRSIKEELLRLGQGVQRKTPITEL